MKTTTTLLLCLFFASISYSQSYVYSFEGTLDSSSIPDLERICENIQSVHSVKIKYKEDSEMGEIFITLDESEKNRTGEQEALFSPVDFKAFLISNNLTPLDFRELKK
ncbi:MAG: hypothetical protein COA33_009595 [Fluviicola sp.]|nr:hypothetical protein [Fluviicola sp.]